MLKKTLFSKALALCAVENQDLKWMGLYRSEQFHFYLSIQKEAQNLVWSESEVEN